MPNILLFGCHEQLVEALAADDRWSVAIGVHRSFGARPPDATEPPDPRHWNLIVDDCKKDNPPLPAGLFTEGRLRLHWVKDGYLAECERAHGIRLCSTDSHQGGRHRSPSGYKTLEFNATEDSRALHLADFIEAFGPSFGPRVLDVDYDDYFTPLFTDGYRNPIIGLYRSIYEDDDYERLLAIDIDDANRRNEALKYLCYRTAPKLWPDIYSGSFQPKRVLALMVEKDKVIAERRRLEEEIEQQIQEEQSFYAPFVNLPYLGNDALKQLVQRVFQDVFGFEVEDLDEKLEGGEPKRLDLLMRFPSASALVEVRARGTRNAQIADIEQFVDNYAKSNESFGPAEIKIFVFNGMYWRPFQQRTANPAFSDDVVSEATIRSIGLISTFQLLDAIESFRNGELNAEQVISALSQPGLIHFPS